MIRIVYEEFHSKINYFLSKDKQDRWHLFPDNGVEFIVVNDIENLWKDATRYVSSTKGIKKENTIYGWGYDGRFEEWTEIDSSDPNYKYLSQYLV